MARIILQNEKLNLETGKKETVVTGFISDVDVLKKRSKKYIKIISSLDHKTLSDTKGMNELLQAIQEEFGTADLSNLPIGILSKCFLGHPYEVHILDLSGSFIVEHYRITEKLPSDFEKARGLAIHNAYALVEVYRDKIILIHEDGTATKL